MKQDPIKDKMSSNKTKPTNASVHTFIGKLADQNKQSDCRKLLELMQKITRNTPKMWGNSIIGFGKYHYRYKSGREGDCFLIGFSPRKQYLSIYLMCDLKNMYLDFEKLGKHRRSVGCLYIQKLSDIDLTALEAIATKAIAYTKSKYG